MSGDDTLFGLANFDVMDGGGGNARFSGDLGSDILFGKGGADWLSGGAHAKSVARTVGTQVDGAIVRGVLGSILKR